MKNYRSHDHLVSGSKTVHHQNPVVRHYVLPSTVNKWPTGWVCRGVLPFFTDAIGGWNEDKEHVLKELWYTSFQDFKQKLSLIKQEEMDEVFGRMCWISFPISIRLTCLENQLLTPCLLLTCEKIGIGIY